MKQFHIEYKYGYEFTNEEIKEKLYRFNLNIEEYIK